MFSVSFFITFLSADIATPINTLFPFSLSRIMMSGLLAAMVQSACTYYYYHHSNHHCRRFIVVLKR
jgi:hypothetical protein